MPAPSLTASYEVESTGQNITSLVSSSFTPSNGEVLVVKVATEEINKPTIGTPIGGSQSYTSRVSQTGASQCSAQMFTAVVSGSPGAMTVTVDFSGSGGWHSMVVERWSGAQLASTPATTGAFGTGAPSATVTTVGTNGIVSWANADWNAIPPGTPAYRSGAIEDGRHDQSPNFYVAYFAYQAAASAGSQTIGLTAPTGQKYTIVGVEVQGTADVPIDMPIAWLRA